VLQESNALRNSKKLILNQLFYCPASKPLFKKFIISDLYFFLFLCRAVIGELDEDLDSQIDLTQIKAPPLKPVTH
jgi:hypothetical protein